MVPHHRNRSVRHARRPPHGTRRPPLASRASLGALCALLGLAAGAAAQVEMFDTGGNPLLEGTWAATVARAGDLDDDGIPDILVGAPSTSDLGYVRVLSGADLGLLAEWQGDRAGEQFGCSVSGVGDANGDGVRDVAVGACGFDDARGKVRVFSGKTGLPLVDLTGHERGDRFGVALEALGDLDLDGFLDFAVGADQPTNEDGDNGYVTIYSGKTLAVLRELVYLTPNGSFGQSIAGIGDANLDGWNDMVVGAPRTILGTPKVILFSGRWLSDDVLPQTLQSHLELLTHLGATTSEARDVDADGYMDYMAGAPDDSFGFPSDGAVKVYSGKNGHTLHTFHGDGPLQRFGASLSGIGDVTADAYDDLLVAAPGTIFNPVGYARVFSGETGEIVFQLTGDADPFSTDGYAQSVSGLGDLNLDGYPELLVGDSLASRVEVWSSVNLWATLDGTALAGLHGDPLMDVRGPMVPGQQIALNFDRLFEHSIAFLVIGLSPLEAPFQGGVLVPDPDVLVGPFGTSGGKFDVALTWPDAPAIPLWIQTWIVDPGGPEGWAATAAIRSVLE
ncbi:MAG: hypothetical protein H6825_01815 [Planctomycetes bacterium]|nr:hypothetical protein [Planctomycetota bacterium]